MSGLRAVASHLLVGVLTTLLGVLDDYTVSVNVRSCMRSVLHWPKLLYVRDLAYFWRCFRCGIVRLLCVAIAMTDSMQFWLLCMWPISMKFGTMAQFGPLERPIVKIYENLKIQHGGDRHLVKLKNNRFRQNLAHWRSLAILSVPALKFSNCENPRWRRLPSWKIEKSPYFAVLWPLRHSRLFKVTDFCTNRKVICDFLLVINTINLLSCTASEI